MHGATKKKVGVTISLNCDGLTDNK